MKSYIVTIFLLLLFAACTNDDVVSLSSSRNYKNPYTVDLKNIVGTGTITEFKAHLEGKDGEVIKDVSKLTSDNEYYLIVESQTPAFHRIGLKGGFEIIQNMNDPIIATNISKYIIKPSDEIANGLALSVIIIHRNGDNHLRESPKRFILPE
jgi:hypothetical protein